MLERMWKQHGLRAAYASLAILLVSIGLRVVRADAATAGLLYLMLVVWCATLAGRAVPIYVAVVSALLFDYYFLEPKYSFGLSGLQAWLAMSAFVISCAVVSRVAERARRQTRHAERRREEAERLYGLNQEMMLHEDPADLVREIPRLVARNFQLAAVLLYLREEDALHSSGPMVSTTILSALRNASDSWELDAALLEGYTPVNLVFGMHRVGTLAWKPPALSPEVTASIAAQVAIVVTRAHAVEASRRLELARSTDRLRTALIDSLTHELRTPLTAIRAAATTLQDGTGLDAVSRQELAAIVDEESSRLDSLIGEAMEIAEIESDGISVRPELLHMATFLEESVERSRADLASHQVTIVAGHAQEPVWFDPHIMGRVLRHLLENAAHHTPRTSHIRLAGQSAASPDLTRPDLTGLDVTGLDAAGGLEFLVEDDGPGIDPHDLPMIFEKFYRGSNRGANARGSGMGLAITRALVAAQGGSIQVESSPARGTSFRIWIPQQNKLGGPAAAPVAAATVAAQAAAAERPPSG